ncbi:hypothetical protein AMR76_16260 [Vibrio furnissii]|uniref:Uncharacterized protein n=1 Tax=Vibrio furnissii TaxID=29494 RepID=A0A0Q2M9W5_VIBFU|nr:hypothetical protein AMR76_16260 [Vibrio furnissii]
MRFQRVVTLGGDGDFAITDHPFNPTLLLKKMEQRGACLSTKMKLTFTPVQTRTTRFAQGY